MQLEPVFFFVSGAVPNLAGSETLVSKCLDASGELWGKDPLESHPLPYGNGNLLIIIFANKYELQIKSNHALTLPNYTKVFRRKGRTVIIYSSSLPSLLQLILQSDVMSEKDNGLTWLTPQLSFHLLLFLFSATIIMKDDDSFVGDSGLNARGICQKPISK